MGHSGAAPGGASGTYGFVWNGSALTNIGDLAGGANSSSARGINDANVVVGYSSKTGTTGTTDHAARWESGILTDLGDLPGSDDFNQAFATNNSGQIFGYSATLGSGNISVNHGVLWQNRWLTDLGDFRGAGFQLRPVHQRVRRHRRPVARRDRRSGVPMAERHAVRSERRRFGPGTGSC